MSNWGSVFSFVLPTKIIFGPGCVNDLYMQLEELGGKRPLIITDRGVIDAGVLEKVEAVLHGKADFAVFDGVEPNPKDRNVLAGAQAYRAFGADSLIAVGGGSPIDCAKAIGVLVANGSDDIKAFEGKTAAAKPIPPLICIPTTAGTGSELTFSSVITDTRNNYKMTIKNAYTAAKAAVCDPMLTLSVPPCITASTGIDALTHAIEAFTATCSEPIADAVALYAIELIYENLLPAYQDGNNLDARSKMLMGSMLAGIAFSHSDVASVHCISEALGGMYDLAHGICNSIILPHVMEFSMDACTDEYARVARAMGLTPDRGRAGAERAVRAVQQLANDVDLPPFSFLNINPRDYERIAEASARNISNASNPRFMTKEDYITLLHKMAGEGAPGSRMVGEAYCSVAN